MPGKNSAGRQVQVRGYGVLATRGRVKPDMKPDFWEKLPLLLSSTCCSSDVEAVTQHSHDAIQLYHRRVATAAANRQKLMDNTRKRIESCYCARSRTYPMDKAVQIIYETYEHDGTISKKTIRRYLAEIRGNIQD